MSDSRLGIVAGAASGLLFGAGLLLSGMASPANVLGFLDLSQPWNPMLLWVMLGALSITLPGFWLMRRRGRPFAAASFAAPACAQVDRRLLAGAALFGVGWGIGGYCPGPALAGAALADPTALLLLASMLVGAWLADRLRSRA